MESAKLGDSDAICESRRQFESCIEFEEKNGEVARRTDNPNRSVFGKCVEAGVGADGGCFSVRENLSDSDGVAELFDLSVEGNAVGGIGPLREVMLIVRIEGALKK
jgi:hypothetical protein